MKIIKIFLIIFLLNPVLAQAGLKAISSGVPPNSIGVSNGLAFNGTSNPDIAGEAYFVQLMQGSFTQSATTYPGGYWGYGAILSNSAIYNAGVTAMYGQGTNNSNSASSYGYGGYFTAYQGANAAPSVFGDTQYAVQYTGAVGGEIGGAFIGASGNTDPVANPNAYSEGIEVSSNGSYPIQAGIKFLNETNDNSPTLAGMQDGILFQCCTTPGLVTSAYIADVLPGLTGNQPAPYGIKWSRTTFGTAEYLGPSLTIGPTVSSYNSEVEITGSASGAPGVTVIGAGASPATNASLALSSLGTGSITLNTNATVNSSGVVSAPAVDISAAVTTVNGSTSGTAKFNEPFQGATYKKIVILLTSLLGTASYTFPTAFTNTPVVLSTSGLATSLVTSLSTTAMTVTGSTSSGILIIEGY